MPLGVPELLIILVILLLIFGPKRLPGLGRQLGGGIREFKDSVTKRADSDDDDDDDEDTPAQLPAATAPAASAEAPIPESQPADPAAPPRS